MQKHHKPTRDLPQKLPHVPLVGTAARVAPHVGHSFRHFEGSDSGDLNYRELCDALAYYGLDLSFAATRVVVVRYDDHSDGKLDVHEFSELIRDVETQGGVWAAGGSGEGSISTRGNRPRKF